MLFRKIKNNYGLTLVESTIALGILMVGILASLVLMLATFNYIRQAEREVVVVNLAREGIEIMRAVRNNQNDNDPNDVDIFDGSYDGKQYFLDIEDDNQASTFGLNEVLSPVAVEQCNECKLYLKNGKYVHDNRGIPTDYRRMITIKPTGVAYEKIILSELSWTTKGNTYFYKLKTHLSDWQ